MDDAFMRWIQKGRATAAPGSVMERFFADQISLMERQATIEAQRQENKQKHITATLGRMKRVMGLEGRNQLSMNITFVDNRDTTVAVHVYKGDLDKVKADITSGYLDGDDASAAAVRLQRYLTVLEVAVLRTFQTKTPGPLKTVALAMADVDVPGLWEAFVQKHYKEKPKQAREDCQGLRTEDFCCNTDDFPWPPSVQVKLRPLVDEVMLAKGYNKTAPGDRRGFDYSCSLGCAYGAEKECLAMAAAERAEKDLN